MTTQTHTNHHVIRNDRRKAPDCWHTRSRTVPLPPIPQTASPTPWLTSIHATPGRGDYGDPRFRGNCSGLLIRDLLMFFQPRHLLDPMCGSGTCADVCRELGIPCKSFDLRSGFDATDAARYRSLGRFDFIWLHPPYWRIVRYSDDPRCLSNAPTLREFLRRLRIVVHNCAAVLSEKGHLAILMGDGKHKGEYLGLPFRTMNIAAAERLHLACPEIIRFSHGATSSTKQYPTSFIPRLHEVCLVLKRQG